MPTQSTATRRINFKRPTNIAARLLLFCGIFGLTASFVLTYDKIQLLKDPANIPFCSINPIITCTSAMTSGQAEILGIPNSLFGIVAYTALIAVSVLLLTGSRLHHRVWDLVLASAIAGTLFMHYLLIQSIFVLHIICPWCFGIWISTPLILVASVLLFYRARSADGLPEFLRRILASIAARPGTILAVWYSVLALTLLVVFWEFWSSLIVL